MTKSLNLAVVAVTALGLAPRTRAEGSHRPGLSVRFATIDSGGGLEANAFLLFSTRDVALTNEQSAPCPRSIQAIAKLNRGPVREVSLTFGVQRLGVQTLTREGCRAMRVTVEDGATLASDQGTLTVQHLDIRPGGRVCGVFSFTAIRDGRPVTGRGSFVIPLPRGP